MELEGLTKLMKLNACKIGRITYLLALSPFSGTLALPAQIQAKQMPPAISKLMIWEILMFGQLKIETANGMWQDTTKDQEFLEETFNLEDFIAQCPIKVDADFMSSLAIFSFF